MRRPFLLVIVGGFLLGALVGAAILILNTDMRGQRVTTSGKALVGGPFTLVGKDGKTVTDQEFRGATCWCSSASPTARTSARRNCRSWRQPWTGWGATRTKSSPYLLRSIPNATRQKP